MDTIPSNDKKLPEFFVPVSLDTLERAGYIYHENLCVESKRLKGFSQISGRVLFTIIG